MPLSGARWFLLAMAVSSGVWGQERNPGAGLDVEVVDASGAGVAGARVALRNGPLAVMASQETDRLGRCWFGGAAAGRFLITVTAKGFAERTVTATVPGRTVVALAVGVFAEEITVAAEAGQVVSTDMAAQRTTVLDAAEVRERTVMALTEAGTGETGVEQVRTSSTMGSFFIRGLTGKNVAVYRDGVRYTTSAQRGGVSTFQNLVDASNLGSVEFVRGPNGAQYGSDAVGGTVNLQSQVAPLASGAGKWYGEFSPFFHSASNGFGGNGSAGYSGRRMGVVVNLAERRVNRFRPGGGIDTHAAVTRFFGLPSTVMGSDRVADSGFTQYGGMAHGQFSVTAKTQVIAHYERGQQDGGKRTDQLLGGDGNLVADLRNLMMDFGYLRVQRFGMGWIDQGTVTVSYNAQREERVNQGGQGNPAAAITNQYERTRVAGVQFQFSKRLGGGHEGLFGGEGYHERMVSPAFTFNPVTGVTVGSRPRVPDGATYKIHGLFVQDVWSPMASGRVRLSGALRFGGATYRSPGGAGFPTDSLTANAVSGRAGGVVRVAGPVSLHATYSRGFRAPSMTDLGTLGIQGNGFFEANGNDVMGRGARIGTRADDMAVDSGLGVERLRPEKTDNYDFGMQVRTGRVVLEGSGFWTRMANTIVSQTLLLPPGAVGQVLGDQVITRQLGTGAVFVPIATQPVLVRANFTGARLQGFEQRLQLKIRRDVTFEENLTYIYAEDAATGLAPDIEPGSPPTMANFRLRWAPAGRRFWAEGYSTVADRQRRIPSISIADRRTGANRSRTNIANFFHNGARVRGLVVNGILVPTGETLAQVQDRVLGNATSAPMYLAVPGWGTVGVRGGVTVGERSDLFLDFSNLGDKSYRGLGWGMDGAGRSVTVKWRVRF